MTKQHYVFDWIEKKWIRIIPWNSFFGTPNEYWNYRSKLPGGFFGRSCWL